MQYVAGLLFLMGGKATGAGMWWGQNRTWFLELWENGERHGGQP